jgi:hypothetical protein
LLLRCLHGASIRLLLLEVGGAAHAAGCCGCGCGLLVVGLRLRLRLIGDCSSLRLALIREHVSQQVLQRRFFPVESAWRACADEWVGLEGCVRADEFEHLAQFGRLEIGQTDLYESAREDLCVDAGCTAESSVVRR